MVHMMSHQTPQVQHIDRRELYTDLETRIRYLHSFLDFGHSDIEALVSGARYVKALIPALVNIVYKKLLQYDITARAFVTRSTSYEGPIDEHPDEDSPQIQHRKMFLRGYLHKLCSDPSEMQFWEYLDKVGMMHVGRGRTHPLHIEYIHIGVTLGMIQDVLIEAILGHPKLSIRRKTALIKALSKVIWIQNDLFAKWYVRDGEEFSRDMKSPLAEEEGFLNGKRVLLNGDEEDEEDSKGHVDPGDQTPTKLTPSECPFAHLSGDSAGSSIQDNNNQTGIPSASILLPSTTPVIPTSVHKTVVASPTTPAIPFHLNNTSTSPTPTVRPLSMSGIPRPVEKSPKSI